MIKPSPSHITLVVVCVTIMATEAAIGGIVLHIKGYQTGAGLTFLTLNTAISGLIGFLGGRATVPAQSQATVPIIPPFPGLPKT